MSCYSCCYVTIHFNFFEDRNKKIFMKESSPGKSGIELHFSEGMPYILITQQSLTSSYCILNVLLTTQWCKNVFSVADGVTRTTEELCVELGKMWSSKKCVSLSLGPVSFPCLPCNSFKSFLTGLKHPLLILLCKNYVNDLQTHPTYNWKGKWWVYY